jgi:uncharacterized protein YraI
MKLTKLLPAIIAPLISLAPNLTAIADAQSIVRNKRCNIEVTGLEEGSQVNMRSGAGVEYEIVGYVLVGQKVNPLRYDAGAAVRERDGEGVAWDYVEYIPSGTRGWIARSFLGTKCFDREGGR